MRATPSALRHEVNLGDLKEKQHLLRPGAACCFPVRHGAENCYSLKESGIWEVELFA